MAPNVTDRLCVKFQYVNPFQVQVMLSTLGDIARLSFEKNCKDTCINSDNFDLYLEERQGGNRKGGTDTYFSIKSDRCLRDVVFGGERFHFTPPRERLRSFPNVSKLYRSTEQIVDECMDDLLRELGKPMAPKAQKAQKAQKVVEFCKFDELKEKIGDQISKCLHPNWTFSICDKGGHQRTLCCHPYNEDRKAYGVYGVTQRSNCMCPLHRDDTFWRRLSSYALTDRTFKIKGDHLYVKDIVGLPSIYEYHRNLEDRFRKTFSDLVDSSYMEKSYIELEREGFVIDEIYPRCEGKGLRNPDEIAHFLAKVFHHKNTQLLIRDNNHARKLRVDTNRYKILVNGSKGGAVEESAKEDFRLIVPSDNAISYMLDLVNTFLEKEPKLEL
jgi:hypothetical protein